MFLRLQQAGFGSGGMLRQNHTRHGRGGGAWVAVVALLAGVGLGAARPAMAQAAGVEQVRPDDAVLAYRLAEQWVRAGEVPEAGDEAKVVSGLLGVRVTLRVAGQPFGEGTVWRDGVQGALGDGGTRPIDLVTLLRPAVREALDDIEQALRDRTFEVKLEAANQKKVAKIEDVPKLAEVGHVFDIDVQLARRPDRVVIAEGAPSGEIYGRFAPGYHGLIAVAEAGAEPGAIWPGNAVAENMRPHRQVVRVLHQLGLSPLKPEVLGRPGGITLYRFDVLHVARPQGNEAPILLIRGHDRPSGRFLSETEVGRMTREVAGHLHKHFIRDAQVRGTYLPSQDHFDPVIADRNSSALASYALLRYALQQKQLGMPAVLLEDIQNSAVAVVSRLVDELNADDATADPSVMALCLLAMHQAPEVAFDAEAVAALAEALSSLIVEDGRILVGDNEALPQTHASVVAAALADHYAVSGDPDQAEPIARLLDKLWQDTGGNFNVYALPWIAWAHDRANPALSDAGLLDEATRAERARTLSQVLDQLVLRQIIEPPTLGPLDVLGGIEFQPRPSGSPPHPDWHTAQALCFIATSLRNPQVVDETDRMGVLITAGGAARFLFQLMIDAPHTFALRNPQRAHGGIRLSLSDNRLAPAPASLSLIALLELRDTFSYLKPPADDDADGGE